MKPPFVGSLLLAALLVTGCSESSPTVLLPAENHHARSAEALVDGVRIVEGEIGPGALYSLAVPEGWNGRLVLYAHGFRDPSSPVDLRDQDNLGILQQRLTDQGYAVAYSSFSENGFAIKDGMQRTHQLRGIFASRFGQPEETLLVGHSLGSLIALGLAERHPQHYAGVLAMCSIAAGSPTTLDYIGHVRALFDFFYPEVLPGSAVDVPDGTRLNEDILGPAQAAMTASLAEGSTASLNGAFAIAAIMEGLGTPLPVIRSAGQQVLVETLVGSIAYVLGFHARGFQDVIERTHDHIPFDNSQTTYVGALPPQTLAAVNAAVERYSATPDARNYLERYYQPTGDLRIPLVMLSNAFDPIAPAFHLDRYIEQVAAAGGSGVVQRRTSVNPFGHCALTVDETEAAFEALIALLPAQN